MLLHPNETRGWSVSFRECLQRDVARAVLGASLTLILMCTGSLASEAQQVRGDFYVANGPVNATAVSGNALYIGGSFTRVGPSTGCGVPISSTSGAPVRGFPRVDGPVDAVVSDGAGGWYIGGRFTSVGGAARNRIAHILDDNTLAPWNPNPDDRVSALAVSGNVVYAAGLFSNIGGQARNGLAALDAATGLATAWDPSPNGFVGLVAASGTTVYVQGGFTTIGGQSRRILAALDATTGLATAWDPIPSETGGAPVFIEALAVDGPVVYVGGQFSNIGGQPRIDLAALDATSGLATPWMPSRAGFVYALTVSGNAVYTSLGAFDATTGQAVATALDSGVDGPIFSMTTSGSTLYVGGRFTVVGGQPRNKLAAIDISSGEVTPWDPDAGNGAAAVRALAASGTSVYAGGYFDIVGGERRNHMAAIDITTGRATAWNPNPDNAVSDLVVRGTTVYAAGGFTQIGGQTRNGLAAVDARTGLALAWNPNPSGPDGYAASIDALAMNETAVYVGGFFSNIGGQPRNNIAAIDPVTGIATAWQPNVGGFPNYGSSGVSRLALCGQTVFAGGNAFLDALDPATGAKIWSHEFPGEDIGMVSALAGDGARLFVGFGRAGSLGLVAALDAATGTVTSWHPDPPLGSPSGNPASVSALAVRGNSLFVGGTLYGCGQQPWENLVALDATTAAPLDWRPNPDLLINALAIAGPNIVAGGVFTFVGQSLQTPLPNGTCTFEGGSPRANLAVIAAINTPPDCSHAVAVPSEILRQHHQLVPVSISGVTDADGDPVAITVTKVTQDEPLGGGGGDDGDDGAVASAAYGGGVALGDHGEHDWGHEDGKDRCADAVIDQSGNVSVRAERSSHGNGRVYTIWFTASDGRGGSCDGSVQVCVPRTEHEGHGDEQISCVDDGQNYNSLGPCQGGRGHDRDAVSAGVTLTTGARGGTVPTLEYSLPMASEVSIAVYDIAGRRVATLAQGAQSAGAHSLSWDGKGVARGMYFCRLQAGSETVTRTVLILK